MMAIYYVETRQGCGLREAKSLRSALASVKRDVGECNVKGVRLATKKDVAWVRGMGGYVPISAKDDEAQP